LALLTTALDGTIIHVDDHARQLYGRDPSGSSAAAALGPGWLGGDGGVPARDRLRRRGYWEGGATHEAAGGPVAVHVVARQCYDGEGRPSELSLAVLPRARRPGRRASPTQPATGGGAQALDWTATEARLQRLGAVSSRLMSTRGVDDVAEVVCSEVVPLCGAFGGAVLVVDPDGRQAHQVGAVGYAPDLATRWGTVPLDQPNPFTDSIRSAEPIWLRSVDGNDVRVPALLGPETDSAAACVMPFRLDGRAFGAFGLSFAGPRTFDQGEREFLSALAHQCALAIHRCQDHPIAEAVALPALGDAAAQGRLAFGDDALVVRLARRFAAGVCAGFPHVPLDDVQLCVSELVTNVMVHGSAPGELRITVFADRVRVDVDDHSPEPPRLLTTGAAIGGRGLRIVDTLASSWGHHPRGEGKTVWAELYPTRRHRASGPAERLAEVLLDAEGRSLSRGVPPPGRRAPGWLGRDRGAPQG
jgi:anti-sigma regulatory factor (Ser/Thr protein kinase)